MRSVVAAVMQDETGGQIVFCDDGSTWKFDRSNSPNHMWQRLPDLPQDNVKLDGNGYAQLKL